MTVRSDGSPHAISVGSLISPDAGTIAFGTILMKETSKNLEQMKKNSSLVSVLVTSGMTSYQIRGKVKEQIKSGPLLDKMNEELKKIKLKATAVWTLEIAEVWNQSASMEAGKKMA